MTSVREPEFVSVHERISAQARARPDSVAVVCGGHRVSYAELSRRSDEFARALRGLNVAHGDIVAIALERSIDMIAALLGTLRAGCAYLPIDPAYPNERLEFMLDDAKPSVLVTSKALQSSLPSTQIPCVLTDGLKTSPIDDDQITGHIASEPDDLAYVIYTSGSTGKPKGCLVSHANLARLFTSTAHWFGFGPDDVWTFFHSHAFDFSVWEIWGALVHGGRVVVVPYSTSRNPTDFLQLLVDERVTVLNQTPSAFRSLLQADGQSSIAPERFALRTVIFGGEALELQMLEPWFDRHGDAMPRLVNMYGITETTVHVTYRPIDSSDLRLARGSVIGEPIPDLTVHLLDQDLCPTADGDTGEMFIGGAGVCGGYLKRPELTAERFIDWSPASGEPAQRLYRSGDLARRLPDGELEYLGRIDQQVKVRGFRIETGEIESQLVRHESVQGCAVIARNDANHGETQLVAYVIASSPRPTQSQLREHLAAQLPEHMIPAAFVYLDALPLTENGKLDRKALPAPGLQRPELGQRFIAPATPVEREVCEAFAEALHLSEVGVHDNFFELGGSSLLVLRVLARLARNSHGQLSTNTFFRLPTPAALARELSGGTAEPVLNAQRMPRRLASSASADNEPIAIIGMAGRFPGAADVEQFWSNLCEGRDSISFFEKSDLDPSLPSSLTTDPNYVPARGVIDGVAMFDAAFFGISPREAELMDPQQRIFMELCWECLERAGHAPDSRPGLVGVFAGMYNATYFQRHVMLRPDLIEKLGEFQVMLANEKDYIATRVAHRLNLTGPAVSVHTACSTSLVAIAQAFASLRAGQCDMALAGGVAVTCPPNSGHLYQDGAMLSPDGITRSFDAAAGGTVFSDGASVVLLKRLTDALADGDAIHAVIRGVAVNNDGRDKASFTAPSVDGQAAVIAAAQQAAGVDPRSISYVEAHGTATPLGDPVEIEGLTRAFRRETSDAGFCRIGSLKSNVGHMVTAAGAAGVIKTALAFDREQLPPTIHFDSPNPQIDFDGSPFVVHTQLTPWPRTAEPRRAGVSSFGVGGTNAHVVLEEAPLRAPSSLPDSVQLLMLSAKSRLALDTMASQLADHLDADPSLNIADVAHTLQAGRSRFAHRLCVVGESSAQLVAGLRATEGPQRSLRSLGSGVAPLVWLFPGQGAQYAGMGRGLYARDDIFREAFDEAIAALAGTIAFDLRARMFEEVDHALSDTATTQPAIFCLEYALARAWLPRTGAPTALVGHSVGEFVAAVMAGVMSLADAARLVARRGALMQALPAGGMMAVRLPIDAVLAKLPPALSLAAENGPNACVVAGPLPELEAWAAELEATGVITRALQTSHAFHSSMMDAAVEPFEAKVRQVALSAPRIPIASTLTGTWMTDADATDPHYWARHLREPVRFSTALRTVLARHDAAFLEIGPRGTLSTLARQHGSKGKPPPVAVASLADRADAEAMQWMLAHGQLWTLGHELSAAAAHPAQGRRRVRLPTYPFERKRFWVEAGASITPSAAAASPAPAAAARVVLSDLAAGSRPADSESIPFVSGPIAMQATVVPIHSPSRRPQLAARLRELFEDVAGTDFGAADAAASFIELGLDSLTLTQAALQVKKHFKVNLSFRQLMESYRSFEALAEFLDASLPADPVPSLPSASASAPASSAVPAAASVAAQAVATPMISMSAPEAGNDFVQQVIQQQMQLMAQQLALLGGKPMAGIAPVAPVAGAAAVPAPAAAAPTAKTPSDDASGGAIRYDVKKAFGAIARIHTQHSELTDRQRARLGTFIRRYTDRTQRSKAYTVENRAKLADPRVVNGFRPMTKEITYQIVVERSKGSRLWDLDGNEYVDALNGFGMNMFGWQPAFVQDAVRAQLDLGYEIGPQHPLAGEVADLVCELTGFDRAGLCNTGSEAVMAAVRIARTVTGRNMVVVFTGSYHGTFDEVLVRAGRAGKGIPAAPGIMAGVFGDVRVLDYGTPDALAFIRDHADELAAVLVEPVQSRRPEFQPRDFLKEVRAVTEQNGACLIFDEVITGFRAHLGGMQAIFGIRADLACYGKVIGGGFPVGVVAGTRDYMDALDGGPWQYGDDSMPTVGVTYFAGTFVRHPLALAAAKASLLHLKQHGTDLQTQLNVHTAAMADELNAFCREAGAPLEIRYFSSLWRVAWLEDHPLQDLLFAMMRNRGVHILDNFPCFMTTAHTPDDIATIKSAFRESVAELQEAEFLPRRLAAAATADASRPPVPNAKLGRDKDGRPAWFVPDANAPGKFVKINI